MIKSAEALKAPRRLKRSQNVASFLEESTESTMSPKTIMNVIVDVHNEDQKSQQSKVEDKSEVAVEVLDKKETKLSERSNQRSRSKNSSRENEIFQKEDRRLINYEKKRTKSGTERSSEDLRMQSLDLIEEFEASEGNARLMKSSSEEKPHRRKQWNTTTMVNEIEDLKKPPRKRWSKDTSVIQLPETSDVSQSRNSRKPIPAPRSSVQQTIDSFFDNPAFVSENEEVLRIETDHKRKSTKIELRRMSDHTNVKDIENIEQIKISDTSNSQCSSASKKKNRKKMIDNHDRSPKTASSTSESRKKSLEEFNSSPSLEKVTDIRSSSITSTQTSMNEKSSLEATQDRSLRKKEQLFKKKDSFEEEISSSTKDLNSMVEIKTETKVRKKKKKKKEEKEKKIEKEGEEMIKYISITIHKAEMLGVNYMNTKRPMVKVHIVEASTGEYLKNTENQENRNTFLLPMITGKFDFKENQSMIPTWEEELIFEHNFNAITKQEGQVVILFEIIDLLSFAEASFSYDRFGSEGCWNKIAWAFLKPIGTNNTLHTDKKMRLQLYRPKRNLKKNERHKCEVYTWWQSNYRDKYPSSLFVTITSIHPPKLEPILYQQLTLNDLSDVQSDSHKLSTRTSDSIALPKWARLAAQSCKIPNEKMFETEIGENGHFYVAFSSDGKYLACAHTEEYNYPILIYEVETGKIYTRFLGHKSFVYSLNWSSDDRCLLSASADQTARIWDVRNKIIEHIEMLPHPSYVYCARYGPNKTTIVATGCYDQVIRIWANDKRSKKRELNQELEGHEGFVNCIVFQKNGNLITADSVGMIILWAVGKNSRMSSRKEWCILRKIKVKEIEGIIINTIILHPLESRLLVHSRNNGLRMLDLATGVILQKYNHLNNQRIQLKACISPCGGLILCGGEDSVLNIWNLETGKHVAKYVNKQNFRTVTCVDYHPYDHVLAFSTFGNPTPVQVLKFNKDASGNDVGLKFIEPVSQTRNNEMIMSVLNYPVASQNKSGHDSKRGDPEQSLRKGKHVSPYHLLNSNHALQARDYEQMQIKLGRLKEAEKTLKNKSSNRLYYIIEKIDKILSNTSRSSDDLESGNRTEPICEGNKKIRRPSMDKEARRQFSETKLSNVNERTSSSIESSVLSNIIELDTFTNAKRYQTIREKRPKSAKELKSNRIVEQDLLKTLSDSATNSKRFEERKYAESSFITRRQNYSSDSSIISFDRTNVPQVERINSSESIRISSLRETKLEKYNSSIALIKDSCNESRINIKTKQIDFTKVSESDSSVLSNATFVIQNAAPVAKPRYKRT